MFAGRSSLSSLDLPIAQARICGVTLSFFPSLPPTWVPSVHHIDSSFKIYAESNLCPHLTHLLQGRGVSSLVLTAYALCPSVSLGPLNMHMWSGHFSGENALMTRIISLSEWKPVSPHHGLQGHPRLLSFPYFPWFCLPTAPWVFSLCLECGAQPSKQLSIYFKSWPKRRLCGSTYLNLPISTSPAPPGRARPSCPSPSSPAFSL